MALLNGGAVAARGGTGRFAGATGSLNATRCVNIVTGSTSGQLVGAIILS